MGFRIETADVDLVPERGFGSGAIPRAVELPSQFSKLGEPFDFLVTEFGRKSVNWEVVVVFRDQRIDVVGGNEAATRAASAGASAGTHLVDGNDRGQTKPDIERNRTSPEELIHGRSPPVLAASTRRISPSLAPAGSAP